MASKWVWAGSRAILLWSLAGWMAAQPPSSVAQETKARLTLSVGQVTVKGAGQASYTPTVLGQTFNPGDMILTGAESRAEITLLEDQGVIRIAEHSLLALVRSGGTDSTRRTEAHLTSGRVWINLKALKHIKRLQEQKRDFHLSSPMVISGVRGTIYRMDVAPDSTSLVRVYEGQVQVGWVPQQAFIPGQTVLQAPTEVAGPQEITVTEWIESIRAGQQALLTPDRKVAVSPFDTTKDAQDKWVKWNRARDK
ncbi:MAG: hypothetical protein A3F84_28835 [Candidatus Handelsmanbacteria bacterium RIFCSPLOWO2_12_FULL_64_10]|uniref:FecR protein domain-containing protein n=1 Tax=Handelsmanbacteria sp. (strain RIFCSPLOWO2_12_FULL_64_10) TaxID=1817868 RepID=A0A1F6D3M2_HANXR|nr:MAG: hypothetical protein A3F84_28835 [Candidatus Handelsmanbacteria bacterium RIFCSPLOWO2_12_FULL_64_10]